MYKTSISRRASVTRGTVALLAVSMLGSLGCPGAPPVPPKPDPAASFARVTVSPQHVVTDDSDEWVTKSFREQNQYTRVILVDGSGQAAADRPVNIPITPLNGRPSQRSPIVTRTPDLVVETLQQASDASRGGDLIAVMPGEYDGFSMTRRPNTDQGVYIRMVALGAPGAVTITTGSREDPRFMAYFRNASHVIFDGFRMVGTSRPGKAAEGTPWAGVMIDGDFGNTGEMAHHIALIRLLSIYHYKWGMHSTDSHTVLMQDSLYGFSGNEHSAYASDGSDNYVIRRNVFLGSYAGGLQCNMDSHASLEELVKHPSMRHLAPVQTTRAWVKRAFREATERFGDGNFPDGRGVNFIIEDNVINGNGELGGGALNLASLSLSLIQNNLLYDNYANGIAQWDDGNAFDKPFREPGPTDPDRFRGPDDLPMFGCQSNLIRNNTVFMDHPERPALQARNGSWGMRAYYNIIVNDTGPSIQIFHTSLYQLDVGPNVTGKIAYEGPFQPMRRVARALPAAPTPPHTQASLASELVNPGRAPWAVLDGTWWKLNPQRPDFRPKPSSKLLKGSYANVQYPVNDLTGHRRTWGWRGAFTP